MIHIVSKVFSRHIHWMVSEFFSLLWSLLKPKATDWMWVVRSVMTYILVLKFEKSFRRTLGWSQMAQDRFLDLQKKTLCEFTRTGQNITFGWWSFVVIDHTLTQDYDCFLWCVDFFGFLFEFFSDFSKVYDYGLLLDFLGTMMSSTKSLMLKVLSVFLVLKLFLLRD